MTADIIERVAKLSLSVPVPVAGSPAPLNQAKPPRYPSTRRAPWQPARAIPSNGKGAATVRLLDAISRNEAAARNLLRPLPPSAMLAR